MLFRRKSRKQSNEPNRSSARLSEDHGTVYLAYVEKQLVSERERFGNLDNKGAALITSSGTLVTLVLAVSALVTSRASFQLNGANIVLAVVALTLFVLAAIAGLITNWTRNYEVPSADTLDDLWKVKKYWKRAEPAARNTVIRWDINTIRTLRAVNNRKAKWVAAGRIVQILATVFLAALSVGALVS